jgi:hypothetical protein
MMRFRRHSGKGRPGDPNGVLSQSHGMIPRFRMESGESQDEINPYSKTKTIKQKKTLN